MLISQQKTAKRYITKYATNTKKAYPLSVLSFKVELVGAGGECCCWYNCKQCRRHLTQAEHITYTLACMNTSSSALFPLFLLALCLVLPDQETTGIKHGTLSPYMLLIWGTNSRSWADAPLTKRKPTGSHTLLALRPSPPPLPHHPHPPPPRFSNCWCY